MSKPTASASSLAAFLVLLLAASSGAAPRTTDWGQGDPFTLQRVFSRVRDGAKAEKFAKEGQGWLAQVLGLQPRIEARVDLAEEYLPYDSPAVALGPVVKVGRAALDLAQSEGEMAFLLGHELHHTLVAARKRRCLAVGAREAGGMEALRRTPSYSAYLVDLEREADAWGQRYAANADYSALDAVSAIKHIDSLGEVLGAQTWRDLDHDAYAERERRLQSFGSSYEASCPWNS